MGDPTMDKDQIERTLAEHLVRDVSATTLRVLGPHWQRHGKNMDGWKEAVKSVAPKRDRCRKWVASHGSMEFAPIVSGLLGTRRRPREGRTLVAPRGFDRFRPLPFRVLWRA